MRWRHLFECISLLCVIWALEEPSVTGQEFPKGCVCYLEFGQGLNTGFQGSPDLFVGELQFRPQYTVIPDHLRIGAAVGALYTNTHLDGFAGPSLALKIGTFKSDLFGSIANFQLQADYLWTSRWRQLPGGGPKIEFGQLLTIGLTVHRDFQDDNWFFETTIGFNLCRQKRPNGPPPDPLGTHN